MIYKGKQFISNRRKCHVEIPDVSKPATALEPQGLIVSKGWLHFYFWNDFGGEDQVCGLFESDKGDFLILPIEYFHMKDSPEA